MEGAVTMDGKIAMDGKAAMDGQVATDGKVLAGMGTPEKGLKSEAVPADTITRTSAVTAKTLPVGAGLQAVGKLSQRRTERIVNDAPLVLPNAVPAQAATAATEAKPLSAADRAEIIRQVADGVGTMPQPAKGETAQQMTLQLHPKDWGQLQISVKIVPGTDPGAAQTVTAHIVAETPQVKAALDNHSGDLRQALREAGLHLDKISVTVQSTEAGAQAGTATSGGRHEAGHGGTNHGGTDHGGASQGGADQGGANQGGADAFGKTSPNQKTGMSDIAGNGLPSFAASGGSQGGRQGSQPPPAYTAAYASMEPEDVLAPTAAPRPMTGQIDTRA